MKRSSKQAQFFLIGLTFGVIAMVIFTSLKSRTDRGGERQRATKTKREEVKDEAVFNPSGIVEKLSKLSLEELISGTSQQDIKIAARYMFSEKSSSKLEKYAKEYIAILDKETPSPGKVMKFRVLGLELARQWTNKSPESALVFFEGRGLNLLMEEIAEEIHKSWIKSDPKAYEKFLMRAKPEELLYKGYGLFLEQAIIDDDHDEISRLLSLCEMLFANNEEPDYNPYWERAISKFAKKSPQRALNILLSGKSSLLDYFYSSIIESVPLSDLIGSWSGIVKNDDIANKPSILKEAMRRIWEGAPEDAVNSLTIMTNHYDSSRLYFSTWRGDEVPPAKRESFLSWLEESSKMVEELREKGYLTTIISSFCSQDLKQLGSLLERFDLNFYDVEGSLSTTLISQANYTTEEISSLLFRELGHTKGMSYLAEVIHMRSQGDVAQGLSELEKYKNNPSYVYAVASIIEKYHNPEEQSKVAEWLIKNPHLFNEPYVFETYSNELARKSPLQAIFFLESHSNPEHKRAWSFALKQMAHKGDIAKALEHTLKSPVGLRTKKQVLAELINFGQTHKQEVVEKWLEENPTYFTQEELQAIIE